MVLRLMKTAAVRATLPARAPVLARAMREHAQVVLRLERPAMARVRTLAHVLILERSPISARALGTYVVVALRLWPTATARAPMSARALGPHVKVALRLVPTATARATRPARAPMSARA